MTVHRDIGTRDHGTEDPSHTPSGTVDRDRRRRELWHAEALLTTGALQTAIFNSANFSSIATEAAGETQIFNVGTERILGYAAADVVNKVTPADIADRQEAITGPRPSAPDHAGLRGPRLQGVARPEGFQPVKSPTTDTREALGAQTAKCAPMRAQLLVDAIVRPLAKEVEVEIADE